MHLDNLRDQKIINRNKNLSVVKKTNPQVLPPAGKNFYEYSNKKEFVSAQKFGSMIVVKPNSNSFSNSTRLKINNLSEFNKKTGK